MNRCRWLSVFSLLCASAGAQSDTFVEEKARNEAEIKNMKNLAVRLKQEASDVDGMFSKVADLKVDVSYPERCPDHLHVVYRRLSSGGIGDGGISLLTRCERKLAGVNAEIERAHEGVHIKAKLDDVKASLERASALLADMEVFVKSEKLVLQQLEISVNEDAKRPGGQPVHSLGEVLRKRQEAELAKGRSKAAEQVEAEGRLRVEGLLLRLEKAAQDKQVDALSNAVLEAEAIRESLKQGSDAKLGELKQKLDAEFEHSKAMMRAGLEVLKAELEKKRLEVEESRLKLEQFLEKERLWVECLKERSQSPSIERCMRTLEAKGLWKPGPNYRDSMSGSLWEDRQYSGMQAVSNEDIQKAINDTHGVFRLWGIGADDGDITRPRWSSPKAFEDAISAKGKKNIQKVQAYPSTRLYQEMVELKEFLTKYGAILVEKGKLAP